MAAPLDNLQQAFEPVSLVSHLRGREREPRHLELHTLSVDRIDGDFYVSCSCAWVSLALASKPDMSRFVCPVGDAEADGRRNRAAAYGRVGRV